MTDPTKPGADDERRPSENRPPTGSRPDPAPVVPDREAVTEPVRVPKPATARKTRRPADGPRNPWYIVGAVLAAVVVLAAIGYFAGLGPLSRLSTSRSIDPPAKLAGLDRITDPQTRSQLKLESTREDLVRLNGGKEATVEAYGNPGGDRLFMVIGLRGRIDVDKFIADMQATPEQIKRIGKATCVAPEQNATQCYRGSNTLTVIVQAANENVDVDTVAPVAAEAFDRMK